MKKILFLSFLLPLLFTSCSSMKYMADYDPAVNFKTYQSFSYLPWNKQSDEILSNIDKKRLRAAVTTEMTKRGYTYTEGNSDLNINIFLIVDHKTGTSTYNDYYSSGPSVGYYYGPWGYNNPGGVSTITTMHSYDYKEGTLLLDILDVSKKQLAWQGIVKGMLRSKPDPEKVDQRIKNVISKLFEEFPVEVSEK